jgi:hypothetical protein
MSHQSHAQQFPQIPFIDAFQNNRAPKNIPHGLPRQALRETRGDTYEKLLPHLSTLGWGRIPTPTGDYIWRQHNLVHP